ncbi:ABC transporter substrate-binding protein [Pediococcus stilesii]|uniref:ABC transporter substrate-binding protein n=1 Tax=Pediococcus stilesii TaxID=331679 RepID=A0A5R9BZK0_9LACO|nr:ABC transporter substrate-binding protein [Pediococcus stilesii]TLQ05730.1 ABC transporter substrate-binding protein [Pediococcus stilesii]
MFKHKRILTLLALLPIVSFLLVACGKAKTATKNQTVTVVLDWTPNTNHTGLYVAKEKGYFKKHHLNVKFVQPSKDGAEQIVASGKAQIGISGQDTLAGAIAKKNPLPLTAIGTILQHNTSGIMSRKADGITSPKKMEGYRYATWNLPTELATIKQVVKDDGGDFSKVKKVPNNITDEVAGLKSKAADDIWVFYGWAGINAKVKNYPVNYFSFRSINPVFDYYTPIIIGNNSFLKKNPTVAKEFMAAATEGYKYAAKNPKASADLLMKAVPELKSDQKLIYESQDYLSKYYLTNSGNFGTIGSKRWNAFYTWLSDNKLVDQKLTKDQGFTNQYLPK